MTGGIRAPRVRVHPALKEAVRDKAGIGLRVRVLAVLTGFPNRSAISTQLHQSFAGTIANTQRWKLVAESVGYTGEIFITEPDAFSDIPDPPTGAAA